MFIIFKKAANYLKAKFFMYEEITIYRLDEPKFIEANCIIKQVDYSNLEDVLNFQPSKYVGIFKDFLFNKDKGYYAYINGKCIHRSWVKHAPQKVFLHTHFAYTLKKNEIFIHYCETAPEARGKSVYPYVLSKIIDENIKSDILISVNKRNIPSRRGVEKVGFKEYYTIRIMVFLGFKFIKKRKSILNK